MRRPTIVLGATGAGLILVAALWLLLAPGRLVRYPADLDQTAVAKGTVTLFADPATGAPAASPRPLPLSIRRNLRVVASTTARATVQETSTEQIGAQPAGRLLQRYVIDRWTMKNAAAPAAYAYTPANRVDRHGAYSINFPFSTGAGPYALFKNETETMYAFRQTGDKVERDGLTLVPMRGSITSAAATDAYVAVLSAEGLPKEMSITQLAPQLKAQGVDLAELTERLLPALAAPDRTAVQTLLATSVPITYLISADTRLLVEPTTGAIVSLENVDQTVTARPDLSQMAKLSALLAKPQYAASAAVQATRTTLGSLSGVRPVKVMRLQYSQTPASVSAIADYARGKADDIRMVKTLIPFGLVMLGVVALLGAAAMATAGPRRRIGAAV